MLLETKGKRQEVSWRWSLCGQGGSLEAAVERRASQGCKAGSEESGLWDTLLFGGAGPQERTG